MLQRSLIGSASFTFSLRDTNYYLGCIIITTLFRAQLSKGHLVNFLSLPTPFKYKGASPTAGSIMTTFAFLI